MVVCPSLIRIIISIIIRIYSEYPLNPTDNPANYTSRDGSDRSGGLIADSGPVSSAARDALSVCRKRH
jgi:hypothetical protein